MDELVPPTASYELFFQQRVNSLFIFVYIVWRGKIERVSQIFIVLSYDDYIREMLLLQKWWNEVGI
jgi:hypothetical protein